MPMKIPYLKSARVKLQERRNSCIRSSYESAEKYVGFFLEFLRSDPVIKTIVAELFGIAQQKFADPEQLVDLRKRSLILPDNATERAAYQLRVLQVVASDEGEELPAFTMIFGKGSTRYQDMFDDFHAQVLTPLCAYIDERIDDGDLLLYSLSRYQRECTWFQTETLRNLVAEANSRKVEEVLDKHLRAWLFRDGVDYPFSTPKSPSGRADITVWHGEEPLSIEVKVYDGQNRDLGHVSQGLWQACRYAEDYGKTFGYLVVFNLSQSLLVFEENVAASGPPCVVVAGQNVFIVVVNVMPERDSASKEKPLESKFVKTPTGG